MASTPLTSAELDELKRLYQLIDELSQSAADSSALHAQNIGNARNELRRLRREQAQINNDVLYYVNVFEKIVKQIASQNKGLRETNKAYHNLISLSEKIYHHQKGIREMSASEIVSLKSQIELERQRLINASALLIESKNQLEIEKLALEANVNYLRTLTLLTTAQNNELQEKEQLLRRVNKEYDETKNALDANLEKIEENNKEFKILLSTAEELSKELGFAGRLVGKLGSIPGIGKALGGITETFAKWGEAAFIVVKLIEGFNSLNKAQVEFGRETGKSIDYVDTLNMSLISSSDYIKTATALSKQFGVNADAIFTKETLQEAAEMVNLMGMGAEEAGKLARFSRISGNDLKASNIAVGKQLESFNKTNRTGISLAANFRDISNTSDAIAMSLGGNAAKIGLANAEARKLGLSLDQVDKIANSLLNFEDSISAELEAELLTGKQINLEQARLYALNNDIVGLTREIGTNQDLINSFAGSNRIQQEAIAKSLGLGREEMAKMIYDQRNINGLSDEQLQKVMGVGSEELKRLSVQESINKSIEKMTEALAGPLEMLAQMLFTGERLKIVFGLVAGILAGKMVSSLVTSAASVAATVISARAYNSALNQGLTKEAALTAMKVAGAEAVSFGAVTASIVGGLAVVAGAIAAFSSMKDGVVYPNQPKRPVLKGDFGTIQLDPKDKAMYGADGSIKVGTDLLGENKFPKPTSLKSSPSNPKPQETISTVNNNFSEITPTINSVTPEITPVANPESLETKSINNTESTKIDRMMSRLERIFSIDFDKMGDKMGDKVKEAISEVKFNVSAKVDNKELLKIQQATALTTELKTQ